MCFQTHIPTVPTPGHEKGGKEEGAREGGSEREKEGRKEVKYSTFNSSPFSPRQDFSCDLYSCLWVK